MYTLSIGGEGTYFYLLDADAPEIPDANPFEWFVYPDLPGTSPRLRDSGDRILFTAEPGRVYAAAAKLHFTGASIIRESGVGDVHARLCTGEVDCPVECP